MRSPISIITAQNVTDSECSSTNLNLNDRVDTATRAKMIAENFDTTCDICSMDLKTLKRAISHYELKHDTEGGYIKCCGLKLKRDNQIDDHIRWHANPNIFK